MFGGGFICKCPIKQHLTKAEFDNLYGIPKSTIENFSANKPAKTKWQMLKSLKLLNDHRFLTNT